MRFCFISTFFIHTTLPLIRQLVNQNHSVDYFLFAKQGQTSRGIISWEQPIIKNDILDISENNEIFSYLDKSVRINIVPYYIIKNRKFIIGFLNYFRTIYIIKKMVDKIRTEKYDWIYIIVNEEHEALLCEYLKKNGFQNIIIAYHEVVKDHLSQPVLKSVVKRTQKLGYPIILHSEHVRQILFKLTENKKLKKLPIGPMELYRTYETAEPIITTPYILYIGSILPYKGLAFMYHALEKKGKDLNCKIVVAGSGYDPVLEEMNKNNRYVVINKFLKDDEFANLVKYAKCVICPYLAGSQSGIPIVAMVFGTPVIATKTAAFEEYIENGINGFLIDINNDEQLINAVNKVLTSVDGTFSKTPKRLEWKTIAEMFVDFCNNLD